MEEEEEGEIQDSPNSMKDIDEDDWVSPEKLQLLGMLFEMEELQEVLFRQKSDLI